MTIAATTTSWLLTPKDVGPGAALVQGAVALDVTTSAMETEGLANVGLVDEVTVEVMEEAVVPANTISPTGSNMKPLGGGVKPSMLPSFLMARGTLSQFQMVIMISWLRNRSTLQRSGTP